jgi:hypothetical protein
MDAEVDLGPYQRVGSDGCLGEESVLPIALDSFGDLSTWHADTLSHRETGESDEHIVLIALDTLDGNTANLALARCAGIGDVGVDYDVLRVDIKR